MNRVFRLSLLFFILLVVRGARADDARRVLVSENTTAPSESREAGSNSTVESWEDFGDYIQLRERNDRVEGLSYMVGGGAAGLLGIVGYQNSTDVVSRTVFALSQSAGLIAIGYGANMYWGGNEYSSFYTAVNESDLPPAKKMELLRRFLDKEREFRRTSKWIQVGTMLLSGAVNFYVASQESNADMRKTLQVLGALNLTIAFTIAY